jgi:Ulp1 family protease
MQQFRFEADRAASMVEKSRDGRRHASRGSPDEPLSSLFASPPPAARTVTPSSLTSPLLSPRTPLPSAAPTASPRATAASGGLFQTPLAGSHGKPSSVSSTPQHISTPTQLVYKLQAEASEHRNEELSRLLEKVQLLKESKAREEDHISKQVEEREKEAAKAKSRAAEWQFVPLTDAEKAEVKQALESQGEETEILLSGFNAEIRRMDLFRLKGSEWLNDEVINFYMRLLEDRETRLRAAGQNPPRCYFQSTFFYAAMTPGPTKAYDYARVRRWTKKTDIFAMDKFFFPLHLGVHWVMICIDFRRKTLEYYDSLSGRNPSLFKTIRQYLQDEHKDKKGKELDLEGWQDVYPPAVPQQMNGFDCGLFACKMADAVSLDKLPTFTQKHMPALRQRMVLEILRKRAD